MPPTHVSRGDTKDVDATNVRQSGCMDNPGSAMNAKRKAHIVRVVIKHNHIERLTVTNAVK
jgi:hypothetical protein